MCAIRLFAPARLCKKPVSLLFKKISAFISTIICLILPLKLIVQTLLLLNAAKIIFTTNFVRRMYCGHV